MMDAWPRCTRSTPASRACTCRPRWRRRLSSPCQARPPMRYAIYLPNFGPYGEARALAEMARDAEQAGWDGLFLWDHIAGWDQPTVDPWVALTAVALATQRLRFGTTVTPLPRR